jgi:DNA gyrase subunit B
MGTHVTGWKAGFTNYIKRRARDDGFLTDKDDNFSGDLIRRGLLLMLSIKMVDRPMFAEQTKLKLTSPEARGACSQAASMLDLPKKLLKQILDKALVEKKADDAAKRAKEAASKIAHGGKNMNSLKDLPEKLADCPDRHGELYLTEGDSAAGNAKIKRNKQNQAVLPLRGKVLNTLDKDLADILENEEIKAIITCLGCGVGENFNIDNLRYDKVIIATDADPDGGHIELLLMCLFLKHLPKLVEAGKIYSAVSPLYKVTNRQGTKFYYSDSEVRGKQGDITHFKGLGEMTPEELYESILNTETRRLALLKPEDIDSALEQYEVLMGKSSTARREFITSHNMSKLDVDDTYEEGDDE